MPISFKPEHATAKNIRFTDDSLVVDLQDGCTLSVPLVWFPRLLHAKVRQRENWELLGRGEGIHWPELDEDISVEGLLLGHPSEEVSRQTRAS